MFTIHGFKDSKRCVCVKGLVFEWIAVFLQSLFSPRRTQWITQRTQSCVLRAFFVFLVVKKKHNSIVVAEVSDTTMPIKGLKLITKK
jgi:hypothetical protein